VQRADAEVRIGLRQEADFAVIAVHQNHWLIIVGYDSVIEFRVFQSAHQPGSARQCPGVSAELVRNPPPARRTPRPGSCWTAGTVAAARAARRDARGPCWPWAVTRNHAPAASATAAYSQPAATDSTSVAITDSQV